MSKTLDDLVAEHGDLKISFTNLPQIDCETLRDRFAMAALSGLLSSNQMEVYATANKNGDEFVSDTVGLCYELADAMMKARDGK